VLIRAVVAVALLVCAAACGGGGPDLDGGGVRATMSLQSSALRDGAAIPPSYRCADDDHLGESPPLAWSAGPAGTAAYAVTVVDTDANGFLHWGLLDLPATTTSLAAGFSPGGALPAGVREARNGYGRTGYGGPCPPTGQTHHYVVTVWALDKPVDAVEDVSDAALARGTLTVTCRR
jgi:Raf kinase inhibitor-like YbhB/YbcL family protein